MRGGGRGGDVVPLGQSVGVPNTELLSCRDFSQHAVENLKRERERGAERLKFIEVSKSVKKKKENRLWLESVT